MMLSRASLCELLVNFTHLTPPLSKIHSNTFLLSRNDSLTTATFLMVVLSFVNIHFNVSEQ